MSERTSGGHLGESLAALVDGELGHAARDRALAHLTHCAACRAEADAHRRLKARLLDLRSEASEPGADLLARLSQLSASAPPPARPVTDRGPSRPRRSAPRRGLRLAGGALLSVGVLLVLTAPAPTTGPAPALDPTSPVLLTRYASLTSEVPLTEPGLVVVPVGAAGTAR